VDTLKCKTMTRDIWIFLFFFILLLSLSWISPAEARASLQDEVKCEEAIARQLEKICDTLKGVVDTSTPNLPNLTVDLNNLEVFRDDYLYDKHYSDRLPSIRHLCQKGKACDFCSIVDYMEKAFKKTEKDNETYLETMKGLSHAYEKLSKMAQKKWKKGVYTKIAKFVVDVSLIPTGPWAIITSYSIGLYEKYGNTWRPKFIPLAESRMGKAGGQVSRNLKVAEVKKLSDDLMRENKKLNEIMGADIPNEKTFFKKLQETKEQASICKVIAVKLNLETKAIYPLIKENDSKIRLFVINTEKKVKDILSGQATLEQCIVVPPKSTLTDKKPLELRVFLVYSNGYRKELTSGDFTMTVDQTAVDIVKLGKSGQRYIVTAENNGTTYVRVVVYPGKTIQKNCDAKITVRLPGTSGQGVKASVGGGAAVIPPAAGTRASVGFIITGDNPPYKPGTTLTFIDTVRNKNPLYAYTYIWFVDGEEVCRHTFQGNSNKGSQCSYKFVEPGMHYAQLDIISNNPNLPQWRGSIRKNIGIEYPPDPELSIFVIPRELPVVAPFKPGQRVDFLENCKNIPNHPKYNWYFEDNKIGSGQRINNYKLPDETGSYDLRLGVRLGSDNFDALKKTITITVGDPPIKPLGRWRNKFRAEGPMTNLRIQSSEWQPGFAWSQGIGSVKSIPAKWKDWVMVRNLDSVEDYDLYTGQQVEGHNSGFLVYLPSGREKLQYKVFGYDFVKHKGVLNHEGYLNMHGKVLDPQSIRWVDKKSRAGVVQWQTTDGSICTARIWKTRGSSTQSVFFIRGGVDDLGCSKGPPNIAGYDPASDPGTGGSSSGTATATQIGQQFQNSNASTGTSSGSGQGGAGNLTNVTVSQQDITVTFWDHGKEDGDIINIYLNGQLFKGNIRLTNAKKKFQVKLNSGSNTFEVEAVNEGSISPNTASVRISHVTSGRGSQIYERKSGKRASMNLSAP